MEKILKFIPLFVMAALIPILAQATPPVGERLDQALESPLHSEPTRLNSSALGTTIQAAIATDITGKTDDRTQLFVVTNLSTSNNVCFGTVAFSGATACSSLCTTAGSWTGQGFAATMNCTSGDASMGSVITAGGSRQFRYDGTRCACVVGSAASSVIQVERVVR